jgi:hypothetical protein
MLNGKEVMVNPSPELYTHKLLCPEISFSNLLPRTRFSISIASCTISNSQDNFIGFTHRIISPSAHREHIPLPHQPHSARPCLRRLLDMQLALRRSWQSCTISNRVVQMEYISVPFLGYSSIAPQARPCYAPLLSYIHDVCLALSGMEIEI